MQPTAFLSLYTHHPWIKQLAKDIQQYQPATFHIKRLAGSLPAVLGASLNQILSTNQLFIVQDKTEAAYLYTDLKNLLPDQSILFYPAVSSGKAKSSDQSTACMQNAVLQQLCEPTNHPHLLITYLEAFFQPTISPSVLQQQSASIISQETIVLAELVKKLTAWGFESVDFVERAGQFATRGGIIDIFSYAHPLPYRLELAGRHIESIRTFDPLTQRSIQKIEKMVLLPSLQPAESTELVSLLDYLPTGSLIWSKDYAYLEDAQTESSTSQLEKAEQKDRVLSDNHPTFRNLLKKGIKKFVCISYGHPTPASATVSIDYPSKPQPEFHQQFDLLIQEFEKNQTAGLHTFIASSSPSQLDRLSQLIHQSNESLTFQTIELALSQGYTDIPLGMACYTDHQIFGRHHRYQSPQPYIQQRGFSLKELNSLQPGDYVVHIDYGIARFSGLTKVPFQGKEQEVVRLLYKGNDVLYVNLHALHKIAKYTGKEGTIPTINKLGSPNWELKKKKVKNKVQDMAKQLIQLYSKRKYAQGFAFSKDTPQQIALEASFIYEDTPDQAAATADVKKDMEVPYPMDRLICGDTGFGKTEVAIRAAFKAVQDQKQVAVLVPTTILALQHYETFTKRLAAFPITIAYVNRFKSQAAINQIRQDSNNGKIDILIGTHKIINKDFTFKDLGLLIIDEEQKFGVKIKEYIKNWKINIDVLTLTATPIPRTLHFSLMGARDLSIIATPPPNRQHTHTSIHTFDKKVIQEAIQYEIQRGGQVFFVHNFVHNIIEIAALIQKLVPLYRIGIAHGQMPGDELEKKIVTFMTGGYDVLISTNIIESGLDVPNANTIIINESHFFGLSDLHQMRGRVGRSNKQAFCYLISPPSNQLTMEARKRLATMEEFSELGDSFKIAMRDLDIRGAGNLLGSEQSGFIADIGFEAYSKVLDEAVQELKETEFKALFIEEDKTRRMNYIKECILETDLELFIPITYVSNDTERLRLYTQLDQIADVERLTAFQAELEDRFGQLPTEIQGLMKAVRLRWLAQQLGFYKVKIKDQHMRCYLSASSTAAYAQQLERVIYYAQTHPQYCQLKEVKQTLILEIAPVKHIQKAFEHLEALGKIDATGSHSVEAIGS